MAGLVTLIILAGIYTASSRKKYFYIASITGILVILLNWLETLEFSIFIENHFQAYYPYIN